MAQTVSHKSPQSLDQGFAIFDECSSAFQDKHTTSSTSAPDPDALRELSTGRVQGRAASVVDIAASPSTKLTRRESQRLEPKPIKCQAVRLTPRVQRPQAHAETFEPLAAVPKESSDLVEANQPVAAAPCPAEADENQASPSHTREEEQMLLPAGSSNLDLEGQVDKHLAATLLANDSCRCPSMTEYKDRMSSSPGHSCQLPPLPHPDPEPSAKVVEAASGVERPESPALTVVSEIINSIASGSSTAASFSASRIEDSLEELDKLEDELEAVRQETRTRQYGARPEKAVQASSEGFSKETLTSRVNKRVSIAGGAATVRVKPSQEKPPALKRSNSLTLRDQKRASLPGSSLEGARVGGATPSQGRKTANHLSSPWVSAKSPKPVTVPKFELPGEAVARRLKEQREARLAQQAEARKAQAPPAPKPRCNKPLARPTFELPGEAISRRKREEREAKLRAEEEEARKRREFKARPIRQSTNLTTTPRDTLTSRARQSQPSAKAVGDAEIGPQRLSVGLARNRARVSLTNKKKDSCQARVRSPRSAATEDDGVVPASASSRGCKRSSVSLEELTIERQRGREAVTKDNSLGHDKRKEKEEREMTAKTAREQAAERSRMASREWAEKKRLKELAGRRAKENRGEQNGMQA